MLSILIFKNVMHVKLDRTLKPFSRAKKYLLSMWPRRFPAVILNAGQEDLIAVMMVSTSKSPIP